MTKISITPEERAEVDRLWLELGAQTKRAADALITGGGPFVGEAMQRFLAEDRKSGELLQRIKAILGIED